MDSTELSGSACKTKLQYDNIRNTKKKFHLKLHYNRLSGTIDCKKEGKHNRLSGIIDCEYYGNLQSIIWDNRMYELWQLTIDYLG